MCAPTRQNSPVSGSLGIGSGASRAGEIAWQGSALSSTGGQPEAVILLQPWTGKCASPVDESPIKGRVSALLPTITMRLFAFLVARHALPAFGFLILTAGTQAQTLNGIRIGEDIATASRIV